jgi:hypothetical protein
MPRLLIYDYLYRIFKQEVVAQLRYCFNNYLEGLVTITKILIKARWLSCNVTVWNIPITKQEC